MDTGDIKKIIIIIRRHWKTRLIKFLLLILVNKIFILHLNYQKKRNYIGMGNVKRDRNIIIK